MSDKPKFDKNLYRDSLTTFKERFRMVMLDPRLHQDVPGTTMPSWNTMDLWATAIMMDEALTLSRLTRVLIALTSVLAVLTGVLVFRSL